MAKEDKFDVVIVGAGITGAIAAKELTEQGFSVLILEAGAGKSFKFEDYQTYLDNYYTSTVRTPNAPFPATAGAPQPLITDQLGIENGIPQFAEGSYFHQVGPSTYQSTYTRQMGGTTLHWLGTCLRMLPSDFSEKTLYNSGKDWPINYYDLMPYYRAAELEIGVSADVDEQAFLGIEFEPSYVYPMNKVPQSYSDLKLQEWTKYAQFKYDGTSYDYSVVSVPQGRNSTPNPAYNNGKGYVPVGAVGNPDIGQRCEGNAACVPICSVQENTMH
ncbi:MAG: FAD-dependent oxidoreductase [Crocinitomicaceae bacterium]|nr:FAD-dependent oxidoreductase [Crocinitomicaceae bacterium]